MNFKNYLQESRSMVEPEVAQGVAKNLKQQIEKLVPDYYEVHVDASINLGLTITVLVFDARKESVKVTWHNSNNIIHIMSHLSKPSGFNIIDSKPAKFQFEKLSSTSRHFKFRKITADSLDKAANKVVMWFKKNQKAIAEAEM